MGKRSGSSELPGVAGGGGALGADPAGVTARASLVDAAAAPALASPRRSRSGSI